MKIEEESGSFTSESVCVCLCEGDVKGFTNMCLSAY
jgi:hypothetical protein